MLEVKSVYATVRLPKDGDTGQVTIGFYTLADGVLTMTDSKGAPVRESQSGDTYLHKMKPGDNAEAIANRLTLEIYRMLRARRRRRQRDSAGRSSIRHQALPE
jgi:hypothetical protein